MSALNLDYDFSTLLNQNEDFNKVQQNFNNIRAWSQGQLSDDNLLASASVYSTYKALFSADGVLTSDVVAASYPLARSADGSSLAANPPPLVVAAVVKRSLPVFYYAATDRFTSGKSEKLRLRVQVITNGTAPGVNFNFVLSPVTFSGGADALSAAAGAAVAGSSAVITAPAANLATPGVGADFTPPADGAYCLVVATSGTLANNAAALVSAQLQTRHV